jgi:hypothetical protein
MNELDNAIYTRLAGNTTLTGMLAAGTASLFHLQAKKDAAYPYVVWSIQGGGDENLTPHRTKNLVVFVRAYSGVSATQAGSIDAQIDTSLHLNPLTVSGWSEMWLAREDDQEGVETEPDAQIVYMAGGFYRRRAEKV